MRQKLTRFLTSIEGLGLILIGVCLGLRHVSYAFVYGYGHQDRPIPLVVGLLVSASLIYLAAVARILRYPFQIRLRNVLLIAVICRMILWSANVIQEADFYRYIWDGQVSLQGISPYRHTPESILQFSGEYGSDSVSQHQELVSLRHLTASHSTHRQILSRVNYPSVPTIYPPVAQGVFAVVQTLVPWSVQGLKAVMLFFDMLCVWLIVILLKRLALDPSRVLIYAWSPLILKEFANSGHMDTIALAAVIGSVLLLLSRRPVAAAISLAIGVGSKYYPLVLVPFMAGHIWQHNKERALPAALAFIGTLAVCFGPFMLYDRWQLFGGLDIYAHTWQLNAGLFGIIEWAVTMWAGENIILTRAVVTSLFFMTLAATIWWLRRLDSTQKLSMAVFLASAAAFIFSPVQAPWYLSWVVPWLCLHPSRAWLWLTALIQFYYLGFYVEYHWTGIYMQNLWNLIKLIEYVPFVLLLAYQGWKYRERLIHSRSQQLVERS